MWCREGVLFWLGCVFQGEKEMSVFLKGVPKIKCVYWEQSRNSFLEALGICSSALHTGLNVDWGRDQEEQVVPAGDTRSFLNRA